MSTLSWAGWGVCASVESLLDACNLSFESFRRMVGESELSGFDMQICGDWQCEYYTDLLVISENDDLTRDFRPVYDWFADNFGKDFADKLSPPGIVSGYIVN